MNLLKQKFNSLSQRKKIALIAGLVLVFVFTFGVISQSVLAQGELPGNFEPSTFEKFDDTYNKFYAAIATVLLSIVQLFASILLFMMDTVVSLFQYNNFIGSEAVIIGWPLVRDLCNMFFVVMILIIAFATILKISTYHYKSTLLKLVIMAILINFSKTILGFVIDFGQVIMLTFVNAFREAALINLESGFGITEWVSFNEIEPTKDPLSFTTVLGALVLAIVLAVVAIFTMLVYVVLLLQRIITLWILVIISPLAFLGSAFPGLSKFSSQFWDKFWKMITVGITMAFFMWLSLTLMSSSSDKYKLGAEFYQSSYGVENLENQTYNLSLSKVSQRDHLFTFIISIALLLLGLQAATEAGGFAGKFAGNVSAKLASAGSAVAKAPFKAAWTSVKAAERSVYASTGIGVNPVRFWHNFQEGRKRRMEMQEKQGAFAARTRYREGGLISSRLAALGGAAGDHVEEFGLAKGLWRLATPRGIGSQAYKKSEDYKKQQKKWQRESNAYGRLHEHGGEQDAYLSTKGLQDISEQKIFLHRQFIEEKAKKEGEIDQTKVSQLQNQIEALNQEEVNLRVHLTFSNEELEKMDAEQKKGYYQNQLLGFRDEEKSLTDKYESMERREKTLTEKGALTDQETYELNNIKLQKEKNQVDQRAVRLSERKTKEILEGGGNYDKAEFVAKSAELASNHRERNASRVQLERERLQKELDDKKVADPDKQKEYDRLIKDYDSESMYLTHQQDLAKKGKSTLGEKEREEYGETAKRFKQNAQKAGDKAAESAPIYGFEGMSTWRAAIAAEMKKVADVDNESELIDMFRESQVNGNKARMAATTLKLCKDANDNELLDALGYKTDYLGMKDFFEKEIRDKGGFSDQEMHVLASDASYVNESVGHWNTARVNATEDGKWKWFTPEEHAAAARAELRKRTGRDISKLNRLAFGGETAGDRKFDVDLLGLHLLEDYAEKWADDPRLLTEHGNYNLVVKLLEAQDRDRTVTKALKGRTFVDVKGEYGEKGAKRDLAEIIVAILRQRVEGRSYKEGGEEKKEAKKIIVAGTNQAIEEAKKQAKNALADLKKHISEMLGENNE